MTNVVYMRERTESRMLQNNITSPVHDLAKLLCDGFTGDWAALDRGLEHLIGRQLPVGCQGHYYRDPAVLERLWGDEGCWSEKGAVLAALIHVMGTPCVTSYEQARVYEQSDDSWHFGMGMQWLIQNLDGEQLDALLVIPAWPDGAA